MKTFKTLIIEASYAGNLGLMELLKFHQLATQPDYNTPDKRVGLVQPVRISDQLVVLNSFSQLHYGRKKGVVYTDHQALLTNLSKLDTYAKKHNLPAYVPARIGCGLAGGDCRSGSFSGGGFD